MFVRSLIVFAFLSLYAVAQQPVAPENLEEPTSSDPVVEPPMESLQDLFAEPFSEPSVREELTKQFGTSKVPKGVSSLSDAERLEKLEGQLVVVYGTYSKGREQDVNAPKGMQDFIHLGGIYPLGTRSNYTRFTGQISYNPSQPFSGFLHEKNGRSWILVFRQPGKAQLEASTEISKEEQLRLADERSQSLERSFDDLGNRDVAVYGELSRLKLGSKETDVIVVDRMVPNDGVSTAVEIFIVGRVIRRDSVSSSTVVGEKPRTFTRWFVQTTGRAYRIKTRSDY